MTGFVLQGHIFECINYCLLSNLFLNYKLFYYQVIIKWYQYTTSQTYKIIAISFVFYCYLCSPMLHLFYNLKYIFCFKVPLLWVMKGSYFGFGIPNNRLTLMQGQKTLSLSYNMHLFLPYLLNDSQTIRSTINFSKPLLCVTLICGDWSDWSSADPRLLGALRKTVSGGGGGLVGWDGWEWMRCICLCLTPSGIALAESARETVSLPRLV